MKTYLYQQKAWPKFEWDEKRVSSALASVRLQQGRLLGQMEHLGFSLQQEAMLMTRTQEVLNSSAIEGENLNLEMVRSSVARRLGIEIAGLEAVDRDVEGVVEMMLDATERWNKPLTVTRLYDWHASLFPTTRSGMRRITVGAWRSDEEGPMQVVSGPIGRQRVHFEAPAASRLPKEMKQFLAWFNTDNERDWVLKAALAHLWFVTIHPFEDGNGRIGRAIADMGLARSEQTSQRFYSMSAQIRSERQAYYEQLERAQRGTLNVTEWMVWFLGCLGRAIEEAQEMLHKTLAKARFWKALSITQINERQRGMLNRLLDDFEGNLTTTKWAKITKTSQDTATRDIQELVALGVLKRNEGGGRSTSYSLVLV